MPGNRRWAAISWWYSSVFVVALMLLAMTMALNDGSSTSTVPGPRYVTFTVTDSSTGSPLEGATVTVGGQSLVTGADGTVKLPVVSAADQISISRDGYQTVFGTASDNMGDLQAVQLSFISMTPTPAPTPPPPTPGTSAVGVVLDNDGAAIEAADVRVGNITVRTDDSGNFSVPYDGTSTEAVISAPGFADRTATVTSPMTIQLEPFAVKGLYLNGTAASYSDIVDNVISLVDRTELNAVVLDTKDGLVYYDSQVEFFRNANAVRPAYDAAELLRRFHEHGIYVIARQVAFKDPLVAEAYPELAIKNESDGELWRGWGDSGEAWVNALLPGLDQPNVDLAVESALLGFDEIQYDYIRFPDGSLKDADFGEDYNDIDKRIAALTNLLNMTRDALHPLGVKLSADIFGWMLLVDDDQGIGQRFEDILACVDYVSPMIYPSHFPAGSLAVEGHPNNHPYDTISIALALGTARMNGQYLKIRPWLQDFTLPGQKEYNSFDIREQIQATEDAGASGWMLWNEGTTYHGGGLIKEGETEWTPPADETPIPIPTAESTDSSG